jgi:hypothetical protein
MAVVKKKRGICVKSRKNSRKNSEKSCKVPIAIKLWGNDMFIIPFRIMIGDPDCIKHGCRCY